MAVVYKDYVGVGTTFQRGEFTVDLYRSETRDARVAIGLTLVDGYRASLIVEQDGTVTHFSGDIPGRSDRWTGRGSTQGYVKGAVESCVDGINDLLKVGLSDGRISQAEHDAFVELAKGAFNVEISGLSLAPTRDPR